MIWASIELNMKNMHITHLMEWVEMAISSETMEVSAMKGNLTSDKVLAIPHQCVIMECLHIAKSLGPLDISPMVVGEILTF